MLSSILCKKITTELDSQAPICVNKFTSASLQTNLPIINPICVIVSTIDIQEILMNCLQVRE